MRLLIVNDDGIHAQGIKLLERIARTITDDVTIVAPASDNLGQGRSLTLASPIRMRRLHDGRYSVAGTPTDAVIMALGVVMKDNPPDLILCGINRGANVGEDVSYSGTVAAAQEGALAGIRSIALSQCHKPRKSGFTVSFSAAEAWALRVLRPLLTSDWGLRTMININFPPVDASKVKGVRIVRQGLREHGAPTLEKGVDPRGFEYWWMGPGRLLSTVQGNTDVEAVRDGFVAITPLHLDMTHEPSFKSLERLNFR